MIYTDKSKTKKKLFQTLFGKLDQRLIRTLKTVALCAADCAALCVAYALSIFLFTYLRLDSGGFYRPYLQSILYQIGSCVLVFSAFRVYRDMWGYISMFDMVRLLAASIVTSFTGYLSIRFVGGVWPSPVIGVTAFYIFFTIVAGIRFMPVVINATKKYISWRTWSRDDRMPLLIVGAGAGAAILIADMQNQGKDCPYYIVGTVDDNISKHKHMLRGVRVLGGSEDVPAICKRMKVREIIIAIPSATTEQRRDLIAICAATGCKVRAMSHVTETGEAKVTDLHNLNVNDLLGRKEVVLDPAVMATYITDNVVMVTGGGGSIGSELCRQIMRFDPKKLIIFDFYENNAYDLARELQVTYRDKADRVWVRIGSVQDKKRLEQVFSNVKPNVVFHAAAYKHVPLMEECPELAVQNNVFGTHNVAECSIKHKVRRFVMISTDKAVNPTNVYGATKRLAEMIIQSLNGQGTEFVAVRFGNVLDSNGSVVPIFRRQIEAGGPVTVMHPEIIRYFMTIPEAVSLVLQAGARAKGGETFVLDMGEPIKIDDLARSMIEMAGMKPEKDIAIEYIGLRPGEKLYEELLLEAEEVLKTRDEKIYVASAPMMITNGQRKETLAALHRTIADGKDLKLLLRNVLPTYKPLDETDNKQAYAG